MKFIPNKEYYSTEKLLKLRCISANKTFAKFHVINGGWKFYFYYDNNTAYIFKREERERIKKRDKGKQNFYVDFAMKIRDIKQCTKKRYFGY